MLKQPTLLVIGLILTAVASPLKGDELTADKNYDQKHVQVELFFDLAGQRVAGQATLKLDLTKDKTSSIKLHAVGMDIEGVYLWGRRPLTYEYKDKKILHIQLDKVYSVENTREIELVIRYIARPVQGLYFYKPTALARSRPFQVWSQGEGTNNRHWFPCYDEPDDRLSSEVIAVVPQGFRVISNGRLVEKKPLPSVKHYLDMLKKSKLKGHGLPPTEKLPQKYVRWHFLQKRAHVSYLVSIIIGRFDTVKEKAGKIKLRYFVPQGEGKNAPYSFARTPAMMKFFQEYLDEPYPWPKYDQTTVYNFMYGGMENTGATTLNMRALRDKRAVPDYSPDSLIAHELIHQWFGDLITCKDWNNIWLNEGFATYFTQLWFEHHEGKDRFRLGMLGIQDSYMRSTRNDDWTAFKYQPENKVPIDLPFKAGRCYTRGAAILHMIRFVLGDKVFRRAVQNYINRAKDRSVESEVLRRAFEETSGRDLSWFFDQWVYGVGFPEFTIRQKWDSKKKLVTLYIKQTHRITPGRGIFRTPVLIEVKGKDYRTVRRAVIWNRETRLDFAAPTRPEMIRFNKYQWIVCRTHFSKPFDQWSHQALHDDDTAGRHEAVIQLAPFGPQALDTLAQVLEREKHYQIRGRACHTLGMIHHEKSQKLLLKALEDKHSRVRREALKVIVPYYKKHKGDTTSLEKTLVQLFEQDKSYYVQANACLALGQLKSKFAFDVLKKAVTKTSHRNVIQERAFRGFQALGDVRAIPIITKYLPYENGRGGMHGNRIAALRALARLDKKGETIAVQVTKYLKDPSSKMRRTAVQIAGKKKLKPLLPRLQVIAKKDPHWSVRGAAQTVVDQLGEKSPEDRVKDMEKKTKSLEVKMARQKRAIRVAELEWTLENARQNVKREERDWKQLQSQLSSKSLSSPQKSQLQRQIISRREILEKARLAHLLIRQQLLDIQIRDIREKAYLLPLRDKSWKKLLPWLKKAASHHKKRAARDLAKKALNLITSSRRYHHKLDDLQSKQTHLVQKIKVQKGQVSLVRLERMTSQTKREESQISNRLKKITKQLQSQKLTPAQRGRYLLRQKSLQKQQHKIRLKLLKWEREKTLLLLQRQREKNRTEVKRKDK